MVDFPHDYVISSTLSIGTIYKFYAPELISCTVPHHFIVIAIEGVNNYLVLCTSQKESRERHFNNTNLDLTGLVYIKPDLNNGLTKDTFVDCNQYYAISIDSLKSKLESGNLSITGTISVNHYAQIRLGITTSHINDLPHYLLVHPEE